MIEGGRYGKFGGDGGERSRRGKLILCMAFVELDCAI